MSVINITSLAVGRYEGYSHQSHKWQLSSVKPGHYAGHTGGRKWPSASMHILNFVYKNIRNTVTLQQLMTWHDMTWHVLNDIQFLMIFYNITGFFAVFIKSWVLISVTPDTEDHNYKIMLSVPQEIKSTHIHICAPPSTNYVFISACAAFSEFSMLYESTMSCCKHMQLLFFCSSMLQKRPKTFFTTFKEVLQIAVYRMVPIISNKQGFMIILIHEMC